MLSINKGEVPKSHVTHSHSSPIINYQATIVELAELPISILFLFLFLFQIYLHPSLYNAIFSSLLFSYFLFFLSHPQVSLALSVFLVSSQWPSPSDFSLFHWYRAIAFHSSALVLLKIPTQYFLFSHHVWSDSWGPHWPAPSIPHQE